MPETKKGIKFIFSIYTLLYILITISIYFKYSHTNIVIFSSFTLFSILLLTFIKPKKTQPINLDLLGIGLFISLMGDYLSFYFQNIIYLKISVCIFFTARVFLYVYSRQFIRVISFNKFRDFAIFLFAGGFGFMYCMYFLIEDSPSEILAFCIILVIIDAILFISSWYIKPEMVDRNYFRIGIGSLIIYDMLLGFNYFGIEYKINIYPILVFSYLYKLYFFKTSSSYLEKQKSPIVSPEI